MIDTRKYLIETLEYYIHKLKNDSCTMDEINSVAKAIEQTMPVQGTIRDFAEFYGRPESQVRVNIFRKVLSKPARVVLYPFNAFHKAVSDKWKPIK